MGLASALSTALTGMSAAETSIDVVGNNLANSNTVGFKASTATFATQFLQTQSSARPLRQQRRHRSRARSAWARWSPRSRRISARAPFRPLPPPSDMAIQGNGMFIMQGGAASNSTPATANSRAERQQPTGQLQRDTTCWATA